MIQRLLNEKLFAKWCQVVWHAWCWGFDLGGKPRLVEQTFQGVSEVVVPMCDCTRALAGCCVNSQDVGSPAIIWLSVRPPNISGYSGPGDGVRG